MCVWGGGERYSEHAPTRMNISEDCGKNRKSMRGLSRGSNVEDEPGWGGVGWGGVRGASVAPLACPIDPSRRVVALHLRRWTWVYSRSWDWAMAVGSSSALFYVPLLLSPSATAQPFCPSPLQKSCCRWACRKERRWCFKQRWKERDIDRWVSSTI